LVDGHPAVVGPRAFDLLIVLVERAGKLVSKSELLDRVWSNLVVEENNLQVQVSALRKILGPEAIATIPGHGYRFTLELIHDGKAAPKEKEAQANHNLPEQLTSFIGRARELTEIKELLQKTQLLTLVGFGGIGKTRLSQEAAADLVGDYPDGIWFVELAPLNDARLIAQAVASVLGVREEPGRPVLEAVLRYLSERRLLLLLDNCEHLVQACADLTQQLLQSGSQLKILATSRERLKLAAETTYTVAVLAMPEPDPTMALETLSRYEAVQLFVDRAIAAQPAFQLTHQNAPAVAAICRRVDGIPLAIELAAARVRAMSAEKIAERLSDRFHLLTRGDRAALPHRQTLRALIDWSHELLTVEERALLRRLAVFPGSFTLEAAEAIGAGDDIAGADILDLLTDLIEKSMVVVEAMGERYRLLESVREYAQERLDESGENDRARSQHLEFYLAFAEESKTHLRGAEQGAWFTRLGQERENLLAAHTWCDRAKDGSDLGLRLVFATSPYWINRGGLELGYRVTMEALQRPAAKQRSRERSDGLISAGVLTSCFERYAEADGYLQEALSIARELKDDEATATALRWLGVSAYSQHKHADARTYLEKSLPLSRRAKQTYDLASDLFLLAEMYRLERDFAAAEPLYEEGLSLARKLGYLRIVINGLVSLASLSVARGSKDRSRAMLFEALAMLERSGSMPLAANVLEITAGLAAFCEDWQRAAQLYGAAGALWQRIGMHTEPADEAFIAPLIAKTREALGASAYATAEAAGRSLSDQAALAQARAWLTDRG